MLIWLDYRLASVSDHVIHVHPTLSPRPRWVDRDCARWNLSPSETQKRRALFWELFITDCWQVRDFTEGAFFEIIILPHPRVLLQAAHPRFHFPLSTVNFLKISSNSWLTTVPLKRLVSIP